MGLAADPGGDMMKGAMSKIGGGGGGGAPNKPAPIASANTGPQEPIKAPHQSMVPVKSPQRFDSGMSSSDDLSSIPSTDLESI